MGSLLSGWAVARHRTCLHRSDPGDSRQVCEWHQVQLGVQEQAHGQNWQ